MKIIFFDFDGVIVDSFSMCYEISNIIRPSTADEYRAMYEGNIYHALVKRPAARPDIDFFDEYAPRLAKHKPMEGVARDIEELAEEHILVIVSSTTSRIIEDFLKEHGLRGHFKEILGSDVERSKSKKIKNILEAYEVLPEHSIFITDTLGDIKEAAECNVKSIGVTWGFHSKGKLEEGGKHVVAILGEEESIAGSVKKHFRN